MCFFNKLFRYRQRKDNEYQYSGFEPFFGKSKAKIELDPDLVDIEEFEDDRDDGAKDTTATDPDFKKPIKIKKVNSFKY